MIKKLLFLFKLYLNLLPLPDKRDVECKLGKFYIFLASYKTPDGEYELRILARNWREAYKKLKLHNKYSKYKAKLDGVLCKEIEVKE